MNSMFVREKVPNLCTIFVRHKCMLPPVREVRVRQPQPPLVGTAHKERPRRPSSISSVHGNDPHGRVQVQRVRLLHASQ